MMNEHKDRETEDDVDFEPEHLSNTDSDESLETFEDNSKQKIKQLQAKLKTSEDERLKLLEESQRAKADFLNARKRLEEQKSLDIERVTLRHIEDILPLADSFEMAMKSPKWNEADEVWRKGVEGIYGQLQTLLKAYNVTKIEALGAAFNPHEHEALSGDGDTVTEVYQTGYKRGEIVIRPAKVSVNT
jgi:molecular chaperone GrpE